MSVKRFRMRRREWAAAAALALLTTGCTATADASPPIDESPTASAPSLSPTVATAAMPEPETVTGVGPVADYPGVDISIPEGARSVVVDFECSGGERFYVEMRDGMGADSGFLQGMCDGAHQFAWPITVSPAPSFYVSVVDGVEWSAVLQFSADEFGYDEAIVANCKAYGPAISGVSNADLGLTQYNAFDEAEWTRRVDASADAVEELVASSQSSLAGTLAEVHAAITDPAREVGNLSPAVSAIDGPIVEACNANHTFIYLTGEFGG